MRHGESTAYRIERFVKIMHLKHRFFAMEIRRVYSIFVGSFLPEPGTGFSNFKKFSNFFIKYKNFPIF